MTDNDMFELACIIAALWCFGFATWYQFCQLWNAR